MVRSIVGTLVDVGARALYCPGEFRAIVESRDLSRSSASPGAGAVLSDVRYPSEIFEPQCYTQNSEFVMDWNDYLADRPRVLYLVRDGHFQENISRAAR